MGFASSSKFKTTKERCRRSPAEGSSIHRSYPEPAAGVNSFATAPWSLIIEHRLVGVSHVYPTWDHLLATSFTAFDMPWGNPLPVRRNEATEKPCLPLDTDRNSRKTSGNFQRSDRPSEGAQLDVMSYLMLRPCNRLHDSPPSFVTTSSIWLSPRPRGTPHKRQYRRLTYTSTFGGGRGFADLFQPPSILMSLGGDRRREVKTSSAVAIYSLLLPSIHPVFV